MKNDLELYDQLHFEVARLYTGLHLIGMQTNDLAQEILSKNPEGKWKEIATQLNSVSFITNDSSKLMLRMRAEIEHLSKQHSGFVDYKNKFYTNRIKELEQEVERLRKEIQGFINK